MIAATVIGGSLAGLATGGMLPSTDATMAFLVISVITATAGAVALLLPRPRRRGAVGGQLQAGMLAMTRQVLRRPGMVPAMTVSIVVASAVDVVIAYLPVYGEEVGLSVELVGLLLSIRGIAGLIARFFMPRLIQLLTGERTLALSMALAGIGLTVLPFVTGDLVLIGLMVLIGIGLGLGAPMTIAWVATRSPRSERATALGVRITGNRGALLVVPSLMGAIAGAGGVMAIFLVLAVSLLGGAAVAAVTPFDELAEGAQESSA
jgi:predicted MFS family arabinose efflux permease